MTGPTVDRDSAFDGETVLHELTRGTSNRLVGNGSGLQWLVDFSTTPDGVAPRLQLGRYNVTRTKGTWVLGRPTCSTATPGRCTGGR